MTGPLEAGIFAFSLASRHLVPALPHVSSDLPQPLRENLALAMARALRDALEDLHAGSAWRKSGLSDPVMAFVNRRAANYCYRELGKLNRPEFLLICDWQPWIEGMWDFAVLRTNLKDRIVIAKTPWAKAGRFARHRLRLIRATLEISIQDGIAFERYAGFFMPVDWDNPSVEIPDIFHEGESNELP